MSIIPILAEAALHPAAQVAAVIMFGLCVIVFLLKL